MKRKIHLLVWQNVELQVLQQLFPVLLMEQEVLLLLWQRGHGGIRGQEDSDWLVGAIIDQLQCASVLKNYTERWLDRLQVMILLITALYLQPSELALFNDTRDISTTDSSISDHIDQ